MKKEFARVFKDRRLLISLVLPGVLIYIIYSLMGNVIGSFSAPDESHTYNVAVENLPAAFTQSFETAENLNVQTIEGGENAVN